MVHDCRIARLLPGVLLATGLLGASPRAVAQDTAPPDRGDVLLLVQSAVDQAQRLRDDALRQAEDALEALDADNTASLAFLSTELGGPREIVKNAPYSAEAITETTQMLMDGNRIVHKSVTLLARDAAGRTRQEKKTDRGGAVYIYDPIEDRSYVLRTAGKTAVPLPRTPTPPAVPAPPPDAAAVAVQPGRVIVRKAGSTGAAGEDVHVEVIRIGRDDVTTPDARVAPMPPMPPIPPLTLHGHALALPYAPRDKGVTEALGSRDFDGVKADGKRTTRTIPAGAIGNEKPIAIVSERWFSAELNIVVMSRNVDPRSGETMYRLANIKRGEPPADLFKVPADYTVRAGERTPRAR